MAPRRQIWPPRGLREVKLWANCLAFAEFEVISNPSGFSSMAAGPVELRVLVLKIYCCVAATQAVLSVRLARLLTFHTGKQGSILKRRRKKKTGLMII